jgi:hypothetical protein
MSANIPVRLTNVVDVSEHDCISPNIQAGRRTSSDVSKHVRLPNMKACSRTSVYVRTNDPMIAEIKRGSLTNIDVRRVECMFRRDRPCSPACIDVRGDERIFANIDRAPRRTPMLVEMNACSLALINVRQRASMFAEMMACLPTSTDVRRQTCVFVEMQ